MGNCPGCRRAEEYRKNLANGPTKEQQLLMKAAMLQRIREETARKAQKQ